MNDIGIDMSHRHRKLLQVRRRGVALVPVTMTVIAVTFLGNLGAVGVVKSGHRVNSTAATVGTPQSELAAIKGADWSRNVKITYPRSGEFKFASNGIPAYGIATYYAVPKGGAPGNPTAANSTVVTSASIERDLRDSYVLPTTPQYSTTTTATPLGPIGITINGASIFNPYEADNSTVALASNFTMTVHGRTGSFIDKCNGHFTPIPSSAFHYHGLPSCIVSHLEKKSSQYKKQPGLVGFAFDGYGIYDNIAVGGSAVTTSQLDKCNGIFSPVPGYPHGIYHYVLENVQTNQSSIGCFHGVVSSAYTHALHQAVDALLGNADSTTDSRAPTTTISGTVTARQLAANKSVIAVLEVQLATLGANNWC